MNYHRKADAQLTILHFVRKNLGRDYEISASKLFALESDFNWEQNCQERGYFCSELIGKVLKSIRLLDDRKSCGRYWPVDFSERGCL